MSFLGIRRWVELHGVLKEDRPTLRQAQKDLEQMRKYHLSITSQGDPMLERMFWWLASATALRLQGICRSLDIDQQVGRAHLQNDRNLALSSLKGAFTRAVRFSEELRLIKKECGS